MRITWEFIPGDCWIGLSWQATPGKRYFDARARKSPNLGFRPGDPIRPDMTEAVTRWDVWACPLPCLPIHLTWFRPRAVVATPAEGRRAA